jgi:hypothetical protein
MKQQEYESDASLSLDEFMNTMSAQIRGDGQDGDDAPCSSADRGTAASSIKRVSFSTVTFHHHSIILGDNPGVMSGAPLSISWKAFETMILNVDDYEHAINGDSDNNVARLRKTISELALTSAERERILRNQGYARGEVKEAALRAEQDKMKRQRTNQLCAWDGAQARMEIVARFLSNLVTLGLRKRQEQQLWQKTVMASSSSSSSCSVYCNQNIKSPKRGRAMMRHNVLPVVGNAQHKFDSRKKQQQQQPCDDSQISDSTFSESFQS